MISIENLTVVYKREQEEIPALQDISFDFDGSAPCAIIGPSGCGKSTLLKAVAGLVDFRGKITLDGKAIDKEMLTIGFMPQNYGLYPWKTVRENILLGTEIKKHSADKYDELLQLLKLEGLENRYPAELSGGQQQRVGLARVFLLQPDILLMDEPFSALDIISRENMQELFMSVWNRNKVPVLFVTHFVEEALYLTQQIAVMRGNPGRIIKTLTSPFFGDRKKCTSVDFYAEAASLRQILQERGEADE